MQSRNYLAMDFGSGSGRGYLGSFDGERIRLREIHRFANGYVKLNSQCYWDFLRLYAAVTDTLQKCAAERLPLVSVGIDAWGTDYVLYDRNGHMLDGCRCTRETRAEGLRSLTNVYSPEALYRRTGIQLIPGNTLFQLRERRLEGDVALENAQMLLMLPCALAYALTGEAYNEYTIASTSMLCKPGSMQWDTGLLSENGMNPDILRPIIPAARRSFALLPAVRKLTGYDDIAFVPTACHDTASAIAAAPLQKNEAFMSGGTWIMIGAECDAPLLSERAMRDNFANEGGVTGNTRLLKNTMGMWAIQRCYDRWLADGSVQCWDDVVRLAESAPAFAAVVNLEEMQFTAGGDMIGRIRQFCRETRQHLPETVGEIARCVYESMALRCRMVFAQLENILGHELSALRVIGGPCRNRLLNRFIASAIRRPVRCGPVEAACTGNVLLQAVRDGEIADINQLRDVVAHSFDTDEYLPKETEAWDAAYGAYLEMLKFREQFIGSSRFSGGLPTPQSASLPAPLSGEPGPCLP